MIPVIWKVFRQLSETGKTNQTSQAELFPSHFTLGLPILMTLKAAIVTANYGAPFKSLLWLVVFFFPSPLRPTTATPLHLIRWTVWECNPRWKLESCQFMLSRVGSNHHIRFWCSLAVTVKIHVTEKCVCSPGWSTTAWWLYILLQLLRLASKSFS